MTMTANAENLRQYKIRFSLIASHPNIVREIKNLLPNIKQIA